MKIVICGGGNGSGKATAGVMYAKIPNLEQVTIITVSNDDSLDASAGRLRATGDGHLGHYGDVSRILGELRLAWCDHHHTWDFMSKKIVTRFESGISGGQTFGDLLATGFDKNFAANGMRGPHRGNAIRTIYEVFGLDKIKNVTSRELLMDLLEFSVEEDDFKNHSLCNLLLFTLERMARQQDLPLVCALDAARDFYGIPEKYRVRLVTDQPTTLMAETISGEVIRGQYWIDFRDRDPNFRSFDEIQRVWLDPDVPATEEAKQAIGNADVVIIAPGSINSNVCGLFKVGGMKEALRDRAEWLNKQGGVPLPIIHVVNSRNEPGNTLSGKPYTAADIVDLVHQAIGLRPTCIIFDSTPITGDDEKHLASKKAKVKLGTLTNHVGARYLERPSLWKREVSMLLRDQKTNLPVDCVHDPKKLGKVFAEVLSEVMAGAHS